MKKICIYHGNCADGFASAVAVRLALGADNVEFHKADHQNPPPNVEGKEVIIVDFSYKRDVVIEMAAQAENILILDHHKTAEADLVDLPENVTTIFDMERSGAVITWQHFFPDEEIPELFLHIQDRDLWKFEIEGTREIQSCVFSYPYDFKVWEQLLCADLEPLKFEGAAISRAHLKQVNYLVEAMSYRAIIAGHDVPVLNASPFYSSDAGHIMAQGEPFAVTYYDTKEGRSFSLRSANDGLDVSEICALFGGGGHKHAAGFSLDSRSWPE